jgi:hypothetical protein
MKSTTENIEKIFDNSPTIEDFYFELYMMWCESVTINSREFQQVLACTSVSKWFNMEFSKLIKEYETSIRQYPNATDTECFTLYLSWIYKLFSISPKALLTEAKKRDKQTAKVTGIKVTTSIFNQN